MTTENHPWGNEEGTGPGKSPQETDLDGTEVRPHFQSLLDAVRSGEIDRVICHDYDRLTREPAAFLRIKDFMGDRDVEPETPDHPA